MTDRRVTLYHSPRSRSTGILTLLEELGASYDLHVIDRAKGELTSPEFLALNPLAKVPVLRDADGAVVTEQVAICLHLADLFPAAGLAPALGDPARGPYLRWMAFYAASFEPALVDRARGVAVGNRAMSPYGDYDAVIATVAAALTPGPYLLGAGISAADILWGSALGWTVGFGIVPALPVFTDYIARVCERPAAARVRDMDAATIARQTG